MKEDDSELQQEDKLIHPNRKDKTMLDVKTLIETDHHALVELEIPEGTKRIGNCAFYNCSNLCS